MAAEKISKMEDDVVLIDTHAFISTKSGFYPGLPNYVIQIIKPTNFIAITASPDEIHNRRMKDKLEPEIQFLLKILKKNLLFKTQCFLAVLFFRFSDEGSLQS